MSQEEGSFVYATVRCLPDWMPSVRGNHSPALVISSLSFFLLKVNLNLVCLPWLHSSRKLGSNKEVRESKKNMGLSF